MVVAAQGVSVGFIVAFSIFAIVLVGLLVYIAVWAIRRDTASRREWAATRSLPPDTSPEP